jgi:hypothetical protein
MVTVKFYHIIFLTVGSAGPSLAASAAPAAPTGPAPARRLWLRFRWPLLQRMPLRRLWLRLQQMPLRRLRLRRLRWLRQLRLQAIKKFGGFVRFFLTNLKWTKNIGTGLSVP